MSTRKKKTTYKEFYPCLLRALMACWDGKPVGSDRLLAWIAANEPEVVAALKAAGYGDAHDEQRTGWSWRQYLGNAMARASRDGRVALVGTSMETPDGYFGPVGLWAPVGEAMPEEEACPLSLRLPASLHERLGALAASQGFTVQAAVERMLDQHPAMRLGLALDRNVEDWLLVLRDAFTNALVDAEVTLPLAQSDQMWVATSLSLRIARALDQSGRPWSVCAQKSSIERMCGPSELLERAGKPELYEEDSDLTIFTRASGRDRAVVATESEAAPWSTVSPDWHNNDYMWDFYKLFRQKAACSLMLARVTGTAMERDVEGRMERLSETFESAVLAPFQHMLWFGQPVLVVILPGASGNGRALLGAATVPGPMLWEWCDSRESPST